MVTRVDHFEALERGRAEFARRLRAVEPDGWAKPTPCPAWDVRALVNHVIGGNRRYTMLLAGATAEEVAATRSMDHLGEVPLRSFDESAGEVATAFRRPGALAMTVHHPAGDRSGQLLLGQRVVEYTVHAWDLARAIGDDETVDPVLVDYLWNEHELVERGQRDGFYSSPAGDPTADASLQARLLRRFGRSRP
jgi:uncharacterized protein (TIGR03086 family)